MEPSRITLTVYSYYSSRSSALKERRIQVVVIYGREMAAGDKIRGVVRLFWHGGNPGDIPVEKRGGNHGRHTVSLG
jgi:hypothetical protein